MQTHTLKSHPAFPPVQVGAVTVRWGAVRDGLVMLRFRIDGCGKVVLPPPAGRGRADDLWKTTCFELFLAQSGGRYREFNFSPSGHWAAYRFNGYRTADGDFEPASIPEITIERGNAVMTATIFLRAADLAGCTYASLTAVIEESGGQLSYWASQHPDPKPDFHNPACFVLPVP